VLYNEMASKKGRRGTHELFKWSHHPLEGKERSYLGSVLLLASTFSTPLLPLEMAIKSSFSPL